MNATADFLRKSVIVAALACGAVTAAADETDARRILQQMSDHLAAAENLSFDYDSTLEVVTTEHQKLGIATSGRVTLARPDRIRATRTGGFADIEMVFDGETFTLLGRHAGAYARLNMPGTVEQLIDELRERQGRALPAADLLSTDAYGQLMSEVNDVKDLGAGVIGGRLCDHLAFRTPEVDWQIWIAQGDAPFPCRFVITTHAQPESPHYQIDIRNWQTGTTPAADAFTFVPPQGASETPPDTLRERIREFPDNFRLEDAQ